MSTSDSRASLAVAQPPQASQERKIVHSGDSSPLGREYSKKKKYQYDAFGRMLVGTMAEDHKNPSSLRLTTSSSSDRYLWALSQEDMNQPQHQEQTRRQQENDSSTDPSETYRFARTLDEMPSVWYPSKNDRLDAGVLSGGNERRSGHAGRKQHSGDDSFARMLMGLPPEDHHHQMAISQQHQQKEGQPTNEEGRYGLGHISKMRPPSCNSPAPGTLPFDVKSFQRASSASTASTTAATTIASSVHSGVTRSVSQPTCQYHPQDHLPRNATWNGGDTVTTTASTATKSETRSDFSLLSTFLESAGMATDQAESIVAAFAAARPSDEAAIRPHDMTTESHYSKRINVDDDSMLQGKKKRKARSTSLDLADDAFVQEGEEDMAFVRQGQQQHMLTIHASSNAHHITTPSRDMGVASDHFSDNFGIHRGPYATVNERTEDYNSNIPDDTFKELCRKETELISQMNAAEEPTMELPSHVEVDLSAPLKRRSSREGRGRGSCDRGWEQQRNFEKVEDTGLDDDEISSGHPRRSRLEHHERYGLSSSGRSARRPSPSCQERGDQGQPRQVYSDQRNQADNYDSDNDSKNVEVDTPSLRRQPSSLRRVVDGSSDRGNHFTSGMGTHGRTRGRGDIPRYHRRSAGGGSSGTNSEELVRALPVVMPQAPEVVVVEGESIPSTWRVAAADKNLRRCVCSIVPLLVIIAVVAALVARDDKGAEVNGGDVGGQVTASPQSMSTSSPTMAPTVTAAPTANMAELQNFFEEFSGDTVYTVGSAQQAAIAWLANVDRATIVDDISLTERYALAVLYFSTSGETSWIRSDDFLNAALPVCGWHRGIFCKTVGESRLIRSIDFSKNDLKGTIPNEIGLLKGLEHLHFGANAISGPIPTTIGLLKSMEDLHFERNAISGSIPEEVQEMKSLVHLHLFNNKMKGGLPLGIFGLEDLRTLDLSGNMLNGTLSESIEGLRSLSALNIQNNRFTGSIPTNLSTLEMLTVLQMDENEFSGKIPFPSTFALRREIVTFSNNRLTGSLPPASSARTQILSDMISLKKLDFSGNSLTGTLSIAIGVARQIEFLDFSGNSFHGILQPDIAMFKKLEYLNLSNTQVGGRLQLDSQSLKILDIHNTNFSGNLFHEPLPSQLEYLNVGGTEIGGSIPAEMAVNATNLRTLKARNCNVTGTIPGAAVEKLSSLSHLDLGENSISGSLPPELGSMKSLVSLQLNDNAITGTVPSALANLKSLRNLMLENNFMTGSVPSKICGSKNLKVVRVDEDVTCRCCGNLEK